MERMNTRKRGAQKEQQVCAYLAARGVKIKEKNFRCRQGEIDIVGYDGVYLVFFEVKYRSTGGMGSASEAVGFAKQKKICLVADYYRMLHHCDESVPIRFDVVAVDWDKLQWIKDAFAYTARV